MEGRSWDLRLGGGFEPSNINIIRLAVLQIK